MNKLHRFRYDGPVMEFDTCINYHWTGETLALSEEKARSNLIFQYKRQNGKTINSKIILPGKIVAMD